MFKKSRKEAREWFRAFLQELPGRTGEWARNRFYGFHAGPGTRILRHVVVYYPENLNLGGQVSIASNCQLNAIGGLTIGDNVLIGPGTYIWTQNHKFEDPIIPIRLQGSEVSPVMIEDDVWIAAGCVILPGVTIGKGSVVAAGAVVTRTAAPFSVIAGVPARRMSVRGELAEGVAARDFRTTLE